MFLTGQLVRWLVICYRKCEEFGGGLVDDWLGGGMIFIVKEKIFLYWIKERLKYIVKFYVVYIFFVLY